MGRPHRQLIGRRISILVLAAGLAACSVVPRVGAPVSEEPVAEAPGGGTTTPTPTASATLLAQSRSARSAGDYVAAGAAIERALRIEPNNAALWLEYGELRLAEGDFEQAETLARKSASLAGENRVARDAAAQLIADVQHARGR